MSRVGEVLSAEMTRGLCGFGDSGGSVDSGDSAVLNGLYIGDDIEICRAGQCDAQILLKAKQFSKHR